MTLHTYGDSHSNYPFEFITIPDVSIIIHWKTATTMATFTLQKKKLCNLKADLVNENDTVIFCFGNIDAIYHLCKKANFKNYKELSNYLLHNYFKAIKLNTDDYKKLKVLIYPILPVLEQYSENVALKGTKEQRKEVAEYIDSEIKKLCITYGYVYFDIYDKLLNDKGYMDHLLCDDTGHLYANIVTEYLKEYL